MAKIKEIWKAIPEYRGKYEASTLGRVKSLHWGKDRILKTPLNLDGYQVVNLSFNGKTKIRLVHQLIISAFSKREIGKEIDHINNIKTDNRLCNLQQITHRENLTKDLPIKSSKYIGVSRVKSSKFFTAYIQIPNHGNKYLGRFASESEAGAAYENALKKLVA